MGEARSLSSLQKEIDSYINGFEEGYFPPMELLARLTEEVGELSREVQHIYGTKRKNQEKQYARWKRKLGICFLYLYALRIRKVLI